MRRALVGTFALALGAGPIGVFLMLRRMSLVGDAMAHAILPGAAIGFLLSGLEPVRDDGRRPDRRLRRRAAAPAWSRARPSSRRTPRSRPSTCSRSRSASPSSRSRAPTSICCTSCSASVLALDDPTLLLIAGNATVTLVVLALI